MPPQLATVFLSHRSPDKPVVEGVAAALRQLGALIWLDKEQLLAGQTIATQLRKGIRAMRQVLLFVSENQLGAWVEDELSWAFELEDQLGPQVIVVLLGCTPEVMERAPALHERMRHDDGTRWNRKFETLDKADLHDPLAHQRLARDIMRALLKAMRWTGEVTLAWAQRHEGSDPQDMALRKLPLEVQLGDAPCLALLPRDGGRGRQALLGAEHFAALREDLDWLAAQLDGKGIETLTVAGAAQHAVFAWVGARWDLSHRVRLRLAGRESADPVLDGPGRGPPSTPAAADPKGAFLLVVRSATASDALLAAASTFAMEQGLELAQVAHPQLLTTQAQLDALCAEAEAVALAGGPRRAVLICFGPTFAAAAVATRLSTRFAVPLQLADYDTATQSYRVLTLRG